jgi:hypothetical protein
LVLDESNPSLDPGSSEIRVNAIQALQNFLGAYGDLASEVQCRIIPVFFDAMEELPSGI